MSETGCGASLSITRALHARSQSLLPNERQKEFANGTEYTNSHYKQTLDALMTAPELPRIINDRYVLHAQPKRGGMADVYKAMDLSADREVAVKVFRFDVLSDALIAEAFRRETEAMNNCSHPNILSLLESGIEPSSSRHYLVFEWMPDSLSELLKRETYRDWDQFYASLGRPILDALSLAHARQVIHRDIKPSNILLDANGIPKLSDFSIAKLKIWHDEGYTLNQFASQLYSAPEHSTESSYSQDLFSYAVLTVRCLTNGMLEDLHGVQEALRSAPVPDDIRSELALCLSEPHERPIIGGLLLSFPRRNCGKAASSRKVSYLDSPRLVRESDPESSHFTRYSFE